MSSYEENEKIELKNSENTNQSIENIENHLSVKPLLELFVKVNFLNLIILIKILFFRHLALIIVE